MNPRYLRGVLTPSQGYVCVRCRLDQAVFQVGGTRRYQQTGSQPAKDAPLLVLADKNRGQPALGTDLMSSPQKSRDTPPVGPEDATKEHGNIVARTSNVSASGISFRSIVPHSENPSPVSGNQSEAQILQQKFTQQRQQTARELAKNKILLAGLGEEQGQRTHDSNIYVIQGPSKRKSKALTNTNISQPPDKKPKARTKRNVPQPPDEIPEKHKKTSNPKLSDTKLEAPEKTSIPEVQDTNPKAPEENSKREPPDTKPEVHKNPNTPQVLDKNSKALKKTTAVEAEKRRKARVRAENQSQQEDSKTLNTAVGKVDSVRSVDEAPQPQLKAQELEKTKDVQVSKSPKRARTTQNQRRTEIKNTTGTDNSETFNELLAQERLSEYRFIRKSALKPRISRIRTIKSSLKPRISRIKTTRKFRKCLVESAESPVEKRLRFPLAEKKLETYVPEKKLQDLEKKYKLLSVQIPKSELLSGLRSKRGIKTVKARELKILAIKTDQPPVPSLSYGLDRVLFNPGIYQLQDPRSRVYNFDPYLQSIMPIKDFEFNALKAYITSSKDESLKKIAQQYGKRYVGSSSSMTGVLAHFHFLLSQWRPVDLSILSKSFPETSTNFTLMQRCPSVIFLKWRDGSYAIDADKEFASASVLSLLGKSMEKLLTLDTKGFERYRKSNPDQVTPEESNASEAYHYSTMGDFLMRSQLDAYDPRLPGTGMFDLKTRAVVSIRMDVESFEQAVGYQIRSPRGKYESYEREYFDMIRAAFLKYSLQVRMGRMDGIFVAFHNIQRIFGFQYISLSEMDLALHGNTEIGDQEFKLSTDLFNQVLNKVTEKYPETSLRIHFETRDTTTSFMYIFAEPMTEDQVEEIQSTGDAKIAEYEHNILGLNSEPNEQGKWADIEASVQEAIAKDERSITELNEVEEVSPEAAGEIDPHSDKVNADDGSIYGGNDIEHHYEEDLAASTEADDDHIDDEDQEEEVGVEEAEKDAEDVEQKGTGHETDEVENAEVEEGADDVEQKGTGHAIDEEENAEVEEDDEEDVEVEVEEDVEVEVEEDVGVEVEADAEADVEEDAVEEADHDANADEVQMEEETIEEEPHGVADAAKRTDDTINHQSLLRDSDGDGDSTSIIQDSQRNPPDQDTFGANLDASNPDHLERSKPSVTQSDAIKTSDERFDTQADTPTTETVAQKDPASEEGEMFAMTLTIRNKVNGKYIHRPKIDLRPSDDWTVEYALAEVTGATRAWSLYRACQNRRKKNHNKSAEYDNIYFQMLRDLSRKGARWRSKQDKIEQDLPRYVVGEKPRESDGKGEGSADQP